MSDYFEPITHGPPSDYERLMAYLEMLAAMELVREFNAINKPN